MTKAAAYLEKNGWKCISRRKSGFVWKLRWSKPGESHDCSQGWAIATQQMRDRVTAMRKLEAERG